MAEEETNAETAAAETPVTETPAAEAEAAQEPAAAEPVAPEEAALDPEVPPAPPAEVLAPKERRQRSRAAKAAKTPVRPARTTEERQQERLAERRRKAQLRRTQRQRGRTKAGAQHGEVVETAAREHEPGKQKTRQGIVVSDRADKTIAVRIDVASRHRRYDKIVRTSTTLHVHDERNDAHVGDTVIVRESRPLSRTKRWRLVEILERAK